jgi:hypothetical protein
VNLDLILRRAWSDETPRCSDDLVVGTEINTNVPSPFLIGLSSCPRLGFNGEGQYALIPPKSGLFKQTKFYKRWRHCSYFNQRDVTAKSVW